MPAYVPDVGDIVWLSFAPQAGREQAGRRAVIVLSPASYNGRVGLMLCCPTTSRIKGYPFEVALDVDPPSVAPADQIRSLDWRARRAEQRGVISKTALTEIRGKAAVLLGLRSK